MKVTFETIKEIRVLNKHKTTVENLTKFEAISNQPSLFWCNGVLFSLAVNLSEFRAVKQFEIVLVNRGFKVPKKYMKELEN